MHAAFIALSNKSTNVLTTGIAHSELGFQMSLRLLVALVCEEMKCLCATLEEMLTDSSRSTGGSAQSPPPTSQAAKPRPPCLPSFSAYLRCFLFSFAR